MSVMLKINSCLDCPYHGIEHDPSSGDSFDWCDHALVCKKRKPSAEELSHRLVKPDNPGRIIVGCSRSPESEYKKEGSKIPKWCPLDKE
jgi:hypothetical protein